MENKTLYAWTESDAIYPAFISIRAEEGSLVFMAREAGEGTGGALVRVPIAELQRLATGINRHLIPEDPPELGKCLQCGNPIGYTNGITFCEICGQGMCEICAMNMKETGTEDILEVCQNCMPPNAATPEAPNDKPSCPGADDEGEARP